jgi:hypothetical protein
MKYQKDSVTKVAYKNTSKKIKNISNANNENYVWRDFLKEELRRKTL